MLKDAETLLNVIATAADGHRYKPEVIAMLSDKDAYTRKIRDSLVGNAYLSDISYHEFYTTNSNGKRRHIQQPSLFTRVLQHLFIYNIRPIFERCDPGISFNCKEGYGITASDDSKSLCHRIKSVLYDRRDLHYALHIDQRKCYEHMTPKLLRKALKMITSDRELIDFGVNVTFHGKSFPIGTPTSPLAHHIIMLAFDLWLGGIPGPKFRYADDLVLFFSTKEEANEAKWRIRNFWWYNYRVYAKRNPPIVDLDSEPLSFCGMVYRRLPGKNKLSHGKGYVRPRSNIRKAARECYSDKSWASYFGILSKTDSFVSMKSIEDKMEFSKLTDKIKIKREFDAEPISIQELAKYKFNIYDFEIRYSVDKVTGEKKANWLRMLVGIKEIVDDEEKYRRYCCKTTSDGMVDWMELVRKAIEAGQASLPIDNCELENAIGYVFKGSTVREQYCSRENITLPSSSVKK